MITGLAGIPAMDSAAASGSSDSRLERSAHEFEAQLMKELLKPLTGHDLLAGDDDATESGALGEFASESLAGALSARGGFGISNRILGELSHFGIGPVRSHVIGNLHTDPGMSRNK